MKHIGELDFTAITHLATHRKRPRFDEHIPLDEHGLPVDRTVCPWCHGKERDCWRCSSSGLVCPTCRGAHIQSVVESHRPLVIGCRDCTNWDDQQEHRWDDHGWPEFVRVIPREAAAIQYAWKRSQLTVVK